MFTVTLLKKAQRWKLPKCLPTDEQINKMWHGHEMEYYSDTKRNRVLINATCMSLENTGLSERS